MGGALPDANTEATAIRDESKKRQESATIDSTEKGSMPTREELIDPISSALPNTNAEATTAHNEPEKRHEPTTTGMAEGNSKSTKDELIAPMSGALPKTNAELITPCDESEKRRESASIDLAKNGEPAKEEPVAPMSAYFKLWSYASPLDNFLRCLATLAAAGGGTAEPLMSIIFGNLVNLFNGTTPEEFRSEVNKNALYFVYLFIGKFVVSISPQIPGSVPGLADKRSVYTLPPHFSTSLPRG